MAQYVINKDIDVEEIGRSGSGRVTAKVTGYWSGDSITMYIRRGWYGNEGWYIEMGHASGGRDTKEVASDVEAAKNFGAAMIAMAEFAEALTAKFDEFEKFYQVAREEARIEREAEKAAKQQAFEADVAMGTAEAAGKVEQLIKAAKGQIEMFKRGENFSRKITVKGYGNATLYINGERKGKKEVINMLAEASARSTYTA